MTVAESAEVNTTAPVKFPPCPGCGIRMTFTPRLLKGDGARIPRTFSCRGCGVVVVLEATVPPPQKPHGIA
jgi:hypothetical protein